MTAEASGDSTLLMAYFGDDYTGSTDALEGLASNGVRTMLFFEAPTPADIERFDGLDAVGIAGRSRSMTPAQMEEALPPVFEAIADLDVDLAHYKVCSTFDSAPEIGSIGCAIDLAQDTFESSFVPVSQGTESPFGRYVVFGNLFAVQNGVPYRIDRHPTMSEHPVTPMDEADLRRHLGAQTDRPIASVDVRAMESRESAVEAVDERLGRAEIVILDALTADHLHTIGDLLWEKATDEPGQLFAVGSSGLEHHALPQRWDRAGLIGDTESLLAPQPTVDRLAVISGSAAPVTAEQIEWAGEHGFATIRLETAELVDPDTADSARTRAVDAALEAAETHAGVVLYSAMGPDDPAIERTVERLESLDDDAGIAERLGREQGRIFAEVIQAAPIDRGCVAGGDTSGYVVPELDIRAMEPLASTEPGAPLCRVISGDPTFDGFELSLKGGQTGTANFFELVREGGAATP